MPVISLSAQDVGADSTHLPSLLSADAEKPMDASPPVPSMQHNDEEKGTRKSIPTPISPIPESPRDITVSSATASASTARPIPPPPTPRRHRSGILMSRVRAHTGGNTFNSSKSFGDLSESALGMSDMSMSMSEAGPSRLGAAQDGKRVASDGARQSRAGEQEDDDEEDMWDNSARFYHRIHSRSASRAGSRVPSPAQSPPVQTRPLSGHQTPASPILVRRNMTMPNGLGPPSAMLSASLSPNHHFLQQHLPPTFPSSPETVLSEPPSHTHNLNHSMVILTPTTQEWRELKGMETGRVDEDELPSSGSSDNSDDDDDSSGRLHRTVSMGSEGIPSSSSSMLIRTEPTSSRPALYQTRSVDVLAKEARHTPDPGAADATPAKDKDAPVFSSNIIAPSPSGLPAEDADRDMLSFQPRGKRRSILEFEENVPDLATDEEGDSSPTQGGDDSPARFASIGRRDSLRVTRKAGSETGEAPKAKSKRELEREKLFKMVDEELEDADSDGRHSYHVTEIGRGGLGTSPTQEEPPRVNLPSHTQSLPTSPPAAAKVPVPEPRSASVTVKASSPTSPPRKTAVSPTQPMRPSPLHASPMTAANGLPPATTPSPVQTPGIEEPVPRPVMPAPENTDEKIGIMRDYAKALASHHSQQSLVREATTTSSPPRSVGAGPRSPRKRDTTRQSLVAGRIVQPYSATPAASLPPERPGMFRQPSSLQSFSPFRSPQLGPSKGTPGGLMPHLSRLDSTISIAPSTGVPSECGTPNSETAGGMGGHGIQDYVIVQEAGKGAYGLVMRARVKGPKGDPIGDEVIIKYIIKARILADCWKKHKKLGPIPVELHVMDQLRHLMYNPPTKPHPWDPARNASSAPNGSVAMSKRTKSSDSGSVSSGNDEAMSASMEKNLSYELEMVLNRGHPNIVKLLDFFEDREFYYLVMPRYGTGLDLFDRIERSPDGLQSFEIRSLLGQLSDAVRFLHANGIVHRDIKDENVILDGEGRCQLIDFGSAAHWRPGKKWDTFSGTMHYASPEIVRGEHYGGKEQDVYALGVVAYVLLIGEPPFSVLPDEALAGLIPDGPASEALAKRCDETPDDGKEADGGGRLGDVADLVRQCMQFELTDRPTADAMCRHRYLAGDGGWTGYKGWLKA